MIEPESSRGEGQLGNGLPLDNAPERAYSGVKFVLVLLGLWVLLYGSFTLYRPALLDDADSVHAEVAREMVARHDWVTLYTNGIRYLEKAPLLYWGMASSFKAFGVGEIAARIPLAFAALALFGVVYRLGWRGFRSKLAGFYAALILVTSSGVFVYTRILIPDVLVCLWLSLAMLCLWDALGGERPQRWACWGFAAACALNVLTKGLIGVVFPVGIALMYLIWTRQTKRLWRMHLVSSTVVFLVIAAPWHVLAGLANPSEGQPGGFWGGTPTLGNVHGFFWFYFVNEHLLRYLNRRIPRDYGTVPLALFWALLLVWIMPWSGFLYSAAMRAWRASRRRVGMAASRADGFQLLCLIWAAAVMVFFSFSTRQEYYALPALPALALLVGGWLAAEEREADFRRAGRLAGEPAGLVRSGRRIAVVLLALGWVGAVAAAVFVAIGKAPAQGVDLASLLSQNPGEYALSLGHFLDLSGRAMGAFRLPLAITALALAIGTAGNWWYRRQGRPRAGNIFLAGMMVGFLVAVHLALVTFSPVLSSRTLARAIQPELDADDLVVIHGEYEAGSTLGFYLRLYPKSEVHIWNGRSSNLWYGSFFKDAPLIFEDDASIAKLWTSPQRLFVWTEPGTLPQLPGPVYVLAKSGGKEIVSNQPNASGAEF